MKREDGYYWVRTSGFWEIAMWHNSSQLWFKINDEFAFETQEFAEIDERQIIRTP